MRLWDLKEANVVPIEEPVLEFEDCDIGEMHISGTSDGRIEVIMESVFTNSISGKISQGPNLTNDCSRIILGYSGDLIILYDTFTGSDSKLYYRYKKDRDKYVHTTQSKQH